MSAAELKNQGIVECTRCGNWLRDFEFTFRCSLHGSFCSLCHNSCARCKLQPICSICHPNNVTWCLACSRCRLCLTKTNNTRMCDCCHEFVCAACTHYCSRGGFSVCVRCAQPQVRKHRHCPHCAHNDGFFIPAAVAHKTRNATSPLWTFLGDTTFDLALLGELRAYCDVPRFVPSALFYKKS